MRAVWLFLSSLTICISILIGLCLCMAIGSFFLNNEYGAAINGMPLFEWLQSVPVPVSWWLWFSCVLLVLLTVNTLVCSTDSLVGRLGKGNLLFVLAPQLVHAGFLFMLLAHLLSAMYGYSEQFTVAEGDVARLPTGKRFGVSSLSCVMSPQGMPLRFGGEIIPDLSNISNRVTVSPNNPWFSDGYGLYIKQVSPYPYRQALMEIHREPGAGAALAGSIFFTLGNVLIVYYRSRFREVADC